MSNALRKIKRKGLNKTHCCGKQMQYKESHGFYVCMECGKHFVKGSE